MLLGCRQTERRTCRVCDVRFEVENDDLAFQALDAYRTGNADFSDYLLILNNHRSGCETTYSCDARLCAHPNARMPEASSENRTA